jgi:hypothetical protein
MVVVLRCLPAVPGARFRDARLMDGKCSATNKSGAACSAAAWRDGLCRWHHPDLEAKRAEGRRKGGKARATKARALAAIPDAMTSDELAGWLSLLFKHVVAGRVEPRVGTAAATIARVLMDVREATTLEQRLAELESRVGVVDTRWRA